MLKKIIISTAILAATTSIALADGVPYVGMNVGLNSNSVGFKNQAGLNTEHLNTSGLTGGLLAGYGAAINQAVYLGGEAFTTVGNMSSSAKTTSIGTTDKLRSIYSYGVDFMPGYKVLDTTMLYAKVGVVKTRFKLTQRSSTLANGTSEQTVSGARFGVGVQQALTSNVDFRGEVVHTAYNSFHACSNKLSPSSNMLTLGFVYKID